MDEIWHHLGALNYCNSSDSRDLRWCKISSINGVNARLMKEPFKVDIGVCLVFSV